MDNYDPLNPHPGQVVVTYEPNQHGGVSDNHAKGRANLIVHNGIGIVGNFLVIENLRLMLANGEINSLTVVFNNENLIADKFGLFETWPKGFGDHGMDILGELIDARHPNKRKSHDTSQDAI